MFTTLNIIRPFKIGLDYFLTLNVMISCQDNQDGHLRRGPLHLQAQREGQEGQVVHEEPGQILKTNPLKKIIL